MQRQHAFRVGLVGLGLLAGLAGAELLVRTWRPPERTQVIVPQRDLVMESHDGVPLWRVRRPDPARAGTACLDAHPDATVVAVVGSSILYGASIASEQVFSTRLQAALDASPPPGPPRCVVNVARSAYSHDQKALVLAELMDARAVELVLWEVWATDINGYTRIGDVAARLVDFEVGPDGLPNPWGLPLWLNRTLLERSRAWTLLTLSSAHRDRALGLGFDWLFATRMPPLLQQVEAEGARMVLLPAPPLHDDFETNAARTEDFEAEALAFAAAHDDVDIAPLDELLIGRDLMSLRLDPCCHYSVAGHEALAEVLEPVVREALAR